MDGLSKGWITTRLADASERDKRLKRMEQRRVISDRGSKASGSYSIISLFGSMTIVVSSQQRAQYYADQYRAYVDVPNVQVCCSG